jgi:hypothetical protein
VNFPTSKSDSLSRFRFPEVGEALRKAKCKEICRRQTLGFTKIWAEMTASGNNVALGAMSRSSFRGNSYNPAEAGRRACEIFLRDTAAQVSGAPPLDIILWCFW